MNFISALLKDLDSAFSFLMRLVDAAPLGVWAVVIGLILANGVEQFLKHWIPKLFPAPEFDGQGIAMPEERSVAEKKFNTMLMHKNDRRDFYIAMASFVVGFLGVWIPYQTRSGVLLALMTGMMASKVLKGFLVVMRPVWGYWVRYWENRK